MKIATLNIDWFKKSKDLQKTICDEIKNQDLDFLVVNENIESFSFEDKYFVYHSKSLPTKEKFQQLDYGIYLKGATPIRTSIYSKYQSKQEIATTDNYTSTCHKFEMEQKEFVIYGTIIGTWGIKYQGKIAKLELQNFKTDIQNILVENENVVIVGDFNTSFIENEKRQLPIINSRKEIVKLSENLNIDRSTDRIENCIDHIFISNNLKQISTLKTATFLNDDVLKDNPHRGIILELNF